MRKLIISTAIVLTLFTTQALAKKSIYAGLDIAVTNMDATEESEAVSLSGVVSSQTISVGNYFLDNIRGYLFYQKINLKKTNSFSTGVGFDYLFGEKKLKPFIGFVIGRIDSSMNSF